MTHLRSLRGARLLGVVLLALAFALPVAGVAAAALGPPQVIRSAACKGYQEENQGGEDTQRAGCDPSTTFSGLIGGTEDVIDAVVIAMLAVTPIGVISGIVMISIGNPKGVRVMAMAGGGMVLFVSFRGIVA